MIIAFLFGLLVGMALIYMYYCKRVEELGKVAKRCQERLKLIEGKI
jgi:hypothetical protein